jgi:hypothetical protein
MHSMEYLNSPVDMEKFWDHVQSQLDTMGSVFFYLPLETKEQALDGTLRVYGEAKTAVSPELYISYHEVDSEVSSRDYFYEHGQELYPIVQKLAENKEFTPSFVHFYAELEMCHGFIMAHLLDDSDDLVLSRGGSSGTKAQRVWFARQLKILAVEKGIKGEEAHKRVVEFVENIRDNGPYKDGFDKKWFEKFFDKNGLIKSTYYPENFWPAKIDELECLTDINVPYLYID